jgi:hypothetical protein
MLKKGLDVETKRSVVLLARQVKNGLYIPSHFRPACATVPWKKQQTLNIKICM